MKKTIAILLVMVFVSTTLFLVPAFSVELPLRVVVNNVKVNFPDAQPYIDSNGRVQVPVRFVTEALGAEVSWNGTSKMVTIKRQGVTVTMKIGEKIINVNGRQKTLDTKAVLISGRTFVPVRFVSEALGAKVSWDAQIRTAYIELDEHTVVPEIPEPVNEGETKYYSGISFNPQRDIAKDGRMKLDKAQEFLMKLLEQTSFYKKDGKYYMQVTYPQLPEGFDFSLTMTIQRNNDKPLIFYSTQAFIKEDDIPNTGTFTRQLGDLKSTSEVDFLQFAAGVNMVNGTGELGERNEGYLYVHTKNFKDNEVTIILNIDPYDSRYIKYDFKKLFKW